MFTGRRIRQTDDETQKFMHEVARKGRTVRNRVRTAPHLRRSHDTHTNQKGCDQETRTRPHRIHPHDTRTNRNIPPIQAEEGSADLSRAGANPPAMPQPQQQQQQQQHQQQPQRNPQAPSEHEEVWDLWKRPSFLLICDSWGKEVG